MNYLSIGQNIRKIRLQRKMRQEDLAEMTDLSTNYIGMIERGEKIPSLETFILLLNALNASADIVLSEVLETGYEVKESRLGEKISGLSKQERERIYAVVETMVKFAKK